MRLAPRAAHQQPEALDRRLAAIESADDAALVHDGDAIGEEEELLEVLADHDERRSPAARSARKRSCTNSGRADVEAPRRLGGDQHLRVEGELAREQRLLQVAARERAGAHAGARAADVEGLDLLPRRSASMASRSDQPARG